MNSVIESVIYIDPKIRLNKHVCTGLARDNVEIGYWKNILGMNSLCDIYIYNTFIPQILVCL